MKPAVSTAPLPDVGKVVAKTRTDPANFVKALTRRRDRLFALIWEFNHQPARYAHPSHMPELTESPLWPRIRDNHRALDRLSCEILRKFQLNNAYCFTFEEPRARLVLVDGDSLAQLMLYSGATLCAPRIMKQLGRQTIADLKQGLGDEVYTFAVKQAVLLLGAGTRKELTHLETDTGNLLHDVRLTGQRLLELCLAGQPEGATRRWELKFPSGMKWKIPALSRDAIAPVRPAMLPPGGALGQTARTPAEPLTASSASGELNVAEVLPAEPTGTEGASVAMVQSRPVVGEKTVAAGWTLVHRLLTREVAPAWSPCFT